MQILKGKLVLPPFLSPEAKDFIRKVSIAHCHYCYHCCLWHWHCFYYCHCNRFYNCFCCYLLSTGAVTATAAATAATAATTATNCYYSVHTFNDFLSFSMLLLTIKQCYVFNCCPMSFAEALDFFALSC